MSEYEMLTKPRHIKNEIKRQHLDWMEVMGKQVKVNFAQHVVQVKKMVGEPSNRPEHRHHPALWYTFCTSSRYSSISRNLSSATCSSSPSGDMDCGIN